MAISRVTSGNAATGSLSFNTGYAVGDLIVINAVNTGSSTVPSVPTGYTSLANASDSTNAWAMGVFYKFAASTTETAPSPSNSTSLTYAIYNGVDSTTPFSGTGGQSGTSTSISYSGIVTFTYPEQDWILTFGTAKGITGNVGSVPPTNTTLVTEYKTGSDDNAFFDTNGPVSSYSFNSKTLAASLPWLTKTTEMRAANALNTVSSQAFNTGTSTGTTSLACTLTTNPTAGNTIVVMVATSSTTAGAVTSITDNQSNTYTLASSMTGSAPGGLYIYYAKNIASSGTFTVTANTASTAYDVMIYELGGLGANATLDVHPTGVHSSGTTTPTMNTGVLTQANAIVIGIVTNKSVATYTAGTSYLNLLNTNTNQTGTKSYAGSEVQFVHATTSTAFNFTQSISGAWNILCVSFYAGTVGPNNYTQTLTGGASFTGSNNKATTKGLALAALGFVGNLFKKTMLTLPFRYNRLVSSDAPIAYWRLGEGTGTQLVDSAAGNNGIYGGTVSWVNGLVNGDSDKAVSFNGTTTYAQDSNFTPLTTAFSVEMLVSIAGYTANVRLLDWGESGPTNGFNFAMGSTTNSLVFTLYNGATAHNIAFFNGGVGTFSLNTTYHLAATYDGSVMKTYVNGSLVSTSSSGMTLTSSATTFTIGRRAPSAGNFFSGTMDEVSYFSGALTAAQVAAHYQAATGYGIKFGGAMTALRAIGQVFTASLGFNGYGLQFDGSQNSASATDNSTLQIETSNQFTVAFWAYIGSYNNNVLPRFWEKGAQYMAIMGDPTNGKYRRVAIECQNASGTGNTNGGASEFWGSTQLQIGQRYFIVGTFDGTAASNQGQIYINNVAETMSDIFPWSGTLHSTVGFDFYMARRHQDNARNFNGIIDHMMVWERILSTAEIDQLYNNYGGVPSGAVAIWNTSEGSGTTAADSSGNANTMTLSGSPAPLWVNSPINLAKSIGRAMSGGASFTGAISRGIGRAFAAAASFVGALTSVYNSGSHAFTQTFTAAITFTGAAAKSTQYPLFAAASFTGLIAKKTAYPLIAGVSFAGAFTRRFGHVLAATVSFSGNMGRRIARAITAGVGFAGNIGRAIARKVASAVSFSGQFIVGNIYVFFAATVGFAGSTTRFTRRGLAGTVSFAGKIGKSAAKAFVAAVSFIGSILHRLANVMILTATLGFSSGTTRRIARQFAAAVGFKGLVQRILITLQNAHVGEFISNIKSVLHLGSNSRSVTQLDQAERGTDLANGATDADTELDNGTDITYL